jgi:Na+/proline symporter
MDPIFILLIISSYFLLLLGISYITSKKADNQSFFKGNSQSPWYLVAFGMIGTSLSGVTFISVPAWVGSSQFSYLQMVLGYLLGYLVVANILMPLYYQLNLTSIYGYLKIRFGQSAYKTGSFYFLLSRTIGAAFRLYLVAIVFQKTIFDSWNIPFWVTVAITIFLIWIYTYRGGIKTIVWTDSLQTLFMLAAVGVTVYQIGSVLKLDEVGWIDTIKNSEYSKVFFFDDWRDSKYFWKQFFSGAFITIVMTGLDQDMMQKNLSCKNIKEAKWNMYSFSAILLFVNILFLSLGALLYIYADKIGFQIPANSDELFPILATQGYLPLIVAVFFILGLIAAAYSSADSALTALTTSVCIDFLEVDQQEELKAKNTRIKVHIGLSFLLMLVILLFNSINDENVVSSLFKAAGYTYGPLLGLYFIGLFTKWKVKEKWIPLVCILAPIITFIIQDNAAQWLNGYQFGFEIIILNGFLTSVGLYLIKNRLIN